MLSKQTLDREHVTECVNALLAHYDALVEALKIAENTQANLRKALETALLYGAHMMTEDELRFCREAAIKKAEEAPCQP